MISESVHDRLLDETRIAFKWTQWVNNIWVYVKLIAVNDWLIDWLIDFLLPLSLSQRATLPWPLFIHGFYITVG